MEITGKGFKLRQWQPGDALSLRTHADNPNVTACLLDRFPSPYSMADALAWVTGIQPAELPVNFAIEVEGQAVGGIGLEFRKDIYRKTPLIGYWMGEQFWGSGIMTEVVQSFTAYTFAQFDVICIQANVLSKNPGSMRVLEKAGYVKQGVLQRSVIKLGEVLDEHLYACFAPSLSKGE